MRSISLPVILTVKINANVELSDADLKTLQGGKLPASLDKIVEKMKEPLQEAIGEIEDFIEGPTIISFDEIQEVEAEFKEDEIEEED